jgi:hypothetical protein
MDRFDEMAKGLINVWLNSTGSVERELVSAVAQALRDAVEAEREACALKAGIHSNYPVESMWDRGYQVGRAHAMQDIRARSGDKS